MEELRAPITLDVGGSALLGKEQIRQDLTWKEVLRTVADVLNFFRSRVRGSVTATGPTSFDIVVNSDWQVPNVRALLEKAGLLGSSRDLYPDTVPMHPHRPPTPDERKPAA